MKKRTLLERNAPGLIALVLLMVIDKIENNESVVVFPYEKYGKVVRNVRNKFDIYENQVHSLDAPTTIEPKPDICDQNPFLLIVVNTNPSRLRNRVTIRETWARRSLFPDVRTIFLMGIPSSGEVNTRVKMEAGLYGDILQADFHDSYRNLSTKGLMSLRWASKKCHTPYFIKTDDDVIIDLFTVMNHLKTMQESSIPPVKSIFCNHMIFESSKVIRDKNNRWFVSPEEFRAEWFGEYCSGMAYIFTGDLIEPMYEMSKHVKLVWVDDFYMSGVLGAACNATFVPFSSLYSVYESYTQVLIDFIYPTPGKFRKMAFIHLSNHFSLEEYKGVQLMWFYTIERNAQSYLSKFSSPDRLIDDFNWKRQIY